jgi:hypothetical protein
MRYLLVSFLRKRAGQIDEMVSVTKRVRTSDMENNNVILDFAEKKVVKCLIEGKEHDTTFDKMRDYYNRVYPNLVGQLEKEAGIEKDRAKLEAKLAPTKKK